MPRKKGSGRKGKSSEPENLGPLTYLRPSGRTRTWDDYLKNVENLTKIPPVNMFRNAPGTGIWEAIAIPNVVVELRNPFAICQTDVYWVGTIIHFAGYFALVKFERFDLSPHHLAWMSYYSNVPHPLGWCKQNGKILYPGEETEEAYPNYLEKLEEFVQGKQTISPYHVEIFTNEISSMINLHPALPVEVKDVGDYTENKIGRISVTCGDRMHVEYLDQCDGYNTGAWFTFRDDSVHPLGWSETVGTELDVSNAPGLKFGKLTLSSFPNFPPELDISAGMYLETRHPVTPHKIVGAVIVKVLQLGYFIVRTCDKAADTRVEFYCHVTNPLIFLAGWGAKWGVDVENFTESPMWQRRYLSLDLLPERSPHFFQPGMVLEAMDITQVSFCGPATVLKVADHMLFIHFNNWSDEVESNSMWVDSESSDIYPIGYSELIGIEFQGHV